MNKQEMRLFLKKKRDTLPLLRRQEASSRAVDVLYGKTAGHRYVLSFASKPEEIDLWPLNRRLAAEGRLLLPRMIEHTIEPCHVSSIKELKLSSWDVLEPDESCQRADVHHVSCVLVPGLGFDKNHQRIGYGFGHFDRFLAGSACVETIGVGFEEQLVHNLLPIEPHDVVLDSTELF